LPSAASRANSASTPPLRATTPPTTSSSKSTCAAPFLRSQSAASSSAPHPAPPHRRSTPPAEEALAVLHPHALAVFTLVLGAFPQLVKAYEHKLERSAANLTFGPFGGAKGPPPHPPVIAAGRDLICVQSLDGVLTFFDQESSTFSRALTNSLVPFNLTYLPRIDALLVANSLNEVECFKYHSLASAGPSDDGGGGALASTKRLQVEWRANVGAAVVDVAVGRLTSALLANQVDVIVLC
jgi:hypothetical protein